MKDQITALLIATLTALAIIIYVDIRCNKVKLPVPTEVGIMYKGHEYTHSFLCELCAEESK